MQGRGWGALRVGAATCGFNTKRAPGARPGKTFGLQIHRQSSDAARMIRIDRGLVLLVCLIATTSCGIKERIAPSSGFGISASYGTVTDLDAAVIDERTIVVGWVADDQAWTRTLGLGGRAGPARRVNSKAWQIRVVPQGDTYQTLVLASGRLYLTSTSEANSTLLLPEDSLLVREFDAILSEAGLLCASTAMRRGMGKRPDVVDFVEADSHSPAIPLFDLQSVPKMQRCPPLISVGRNGIVIRVIGPLPDSANPSGNRIPDRVDSQVIAGEPWRLMNTDSEELKLQVERYKARGEERILEVRGIHTALGWRWTRSPMRRFADPGPDRVRVQVKAFSCADQRDLGMLVDWGSAVDWVRWPVDSAIARHVRVSLGTAEVFGRPKVGVVQWRDSTAVLAWVDRARERSSPEWNTSLTSSGLPVGDIHVALAKPDGSLRRLSLDGLPTMANACALRVLHAGDRTIFVWVRSISAPQFLEGFGRQVSIEACAVSDARLRSQPTVPFD